MIQRTLPIGQEQVRFTVRDRQLVATGWSGAHLLESPTRFPRIDGYGDAELARLWQTRWNPADWHSRSNMPRPLD